MHAEHNFEPQGETTSYTWRLTFTEHNILARPSSGLPPKSSVRHSHIRPQPSQHFSKLNSTTTVKLDTTDRTPTEALPNDPTMAHCVEGKRSRSAT